MTEPFIWPEHFRLMEAIAHHLYRTDPAFGAVQRAVRR